MTAATEPPATMRRRVWWSALVTGAGLAGLADTVVFHELLHWHHFYDRSTAGVGLTSDGLLDAVLIAGLVVGVVGLVERAGSARGWGRLVWAGMLVGFGGFNLFDGLIDHKLLRLHQIRPGAASQLPYDVAWIASSVLILAVGVALLRAGRGRP
jgi:uncharacterized membrane protein